MRHYTKVGIKRGTDNLNLNCPWLLGHSMASRKIKCGCRMCKMRTNNTEIICRCYG